MPGPLPSPTLSSLQRERAVTMVAVLGTGGIGTRHLEVLDALAMVKPIAVPARPARVAEWEARSMLAARSLREAVALGASHAIIATDTGRHVDDAREAVSLGLDVLVEKPLACSGAEARALQRNTQVAGRHIWVGCVMRFCESLNTFRAWLPMIGSIHTVRIECQSYLPDWRPARPYQESYSARGREGGVLLDLIHEVDYAGWLFGWPAAVRARLRNLGRLGIDAEEAAELMWETPTGALVTLSLDYLTKPPRRRMRACGEQGTLEWDGLARTVTRSPAGETPVVASSAQERNEMFAAQAQAFLSATPERCDARLATTEDGIRALVVCDAARVSSMTGRETPVDVDDR